MPKPLVRERQRNDQKEYSLLSVSSQQSKQTLELQTDKIKLDRLLRKPRSKKYIEAIRKLDAGGHVQNRKQVEEILDEIREEFPEVNIMGILIGFVAKCHLGRPYEVHSLTVTGAIIEHFQMGHPMPFGLEKARGIAIRGGYEVIEVYADCCRAISSNGAVSVIPG